MNTILCKLDLFEYIDGVFYQVAIIVLLLLLGWFKIGDKVVNSINERKLNKYNDNNYKKLKLKRIDDTHYKIRGKHYKVKNANAIKNVPRTYFGRVVETYQLEGPFIKTRNTLIDKASVLGVYIGYEYSRKNKKTNIKYILLLIFSVVLSQFLSMSSEYGGYKYVLFIFILFLFVFHIINYRDDKISLEAQPSTIIKTREGDFVVGTAMFFYEVVDMLGYNNANKQAMSNAE